MSCFEASDHEGHDVQFLAVPTFVSRPLVATTWTWLTRALLNRPRQVDAGGSCDCGDTEAWSAEGCCPKHRPDEAADAGRTPAVHAGIRGAGVDTGAKQCGDVL